MAVKQYKVKKVVASVTPPGRVVTLSEEPPGVPPADDLVITDSTADEWVLFNAAYGATVTVTTDAQGARTGTSRP